VSEGELSRLIGKTRAGTPVLNIELLGNAGFGVRVESESLNTEQLKHILDEGFPVIAAVRTEPLLYWKTDRPHTVVVIGYDEASVHLNDPKFPNAPQIVSWGEFLTAWNRLGRFTAVIRRVETK
ncbi:MAG: C39 family peptidase, partial [Candidatus Poribacteria bacterium]